ncbi:putative NRPS-like protein biosynthetic cluster [Claviceps citrina]|nr:putative NRPS-like protein biosynthetic cluster [Claviceps citrina]
MVAPTIATVPVRIQLDQDRRVLELLETVRQQATDMMPFEQSGLQKIAETCPAAAKACAFQILLVVQPQDDNDGDWISKTDVGTWRDGSPKYWSDTYPLTIELRLGTDEIGASAMFKSEVIDRWTVEKLMQRLNFVLRQLDVAGPEQTLRGINMVTEEDLQQVWEGNSTVPPAIHLDIYEPIARWTKDRPEDAFAVLHAGGCLCVPSDADRRGNLEQSMTSLRANILQLTPSVFQLLSPASVPDVDTCTPTSTINYDATCPEEAVHIGKGAGVVTWVVNPANSHELAPAGCVGELLLEGPLVGSGYLNNDERTASAFVQNPSWLLRGTTSRPGRHGRLYKTGDLVRYSGEKGNLTFIGRKDAQVKLRGQRVELGEIEHWIKLLVPEASRAALTSWLSIYPATWCQPTSSACKHWPITATGKLDRRRLRDIGACFAAQQLAETTSRNPESVGQPTSEAELVLQGIWARVLNMDASTIRLGDNFFRLGGDSMAAMMLTGEARKAGVSLSVEEIFRCPTLAQQARSQTSSGSPTETRPLAPFSMLGRKGENLRQDLASLCGLDAAQVKDAYPCTPLQGGLISLTAKRHGDYTMRAVLELAEHVDVSAWKEAWNKVIRLTPILRTRIVQHKEHGLLQVVVAHECIDWIGATDLTAYLRSDRTQFMGLCKPLTRLSLVKNSSGRVQWFVWTLHLALYDGWSMNLMLDAVQRAYQGESIRAGPQFQTFLSYLRDQDSATADRYWWSSLANCECVQFPALPPSVDQPVTETTVEYRFSRLPQERSRNITVPNLIRAAWALIAGRMSDTDDVVFGASVSGRNAPVAGIDGLVAPTFATVPVRVRLDKNQPISDYLDAVQVQTTGMIAFEQSGLHRIAKLSPDCAKACSFQTLLLVVQSQNTPSTTTKEEIWKWQDDSTR